MKDRKQSPTSGPDWFSPRGPDAENAAPGDFVESVPEVGAVPSNDKSGDDAGRGERAPDSGTTMVDVRASSPSRKKRLPFWLLIYAAFVVGLGFYFVVMAEDRYVSRSKFVVTRGADDKSGLASMLGPSQNDQDAYAAIAHIYSADMVEWLAANDFDLREHYSKAGNDYPYKLATDAPLEDVLEYFTDRVEARLDEQKGIVTLEVEAFTRNYAQAITEAILSRMDSYVNELNREIAGRRLEFISSELDNSQKRLERADEAMLDFQNAHQTIDPQADLKADLELVSSLRKAVAFFRADVARIRGESPNSPRIPDIEAKIKALTAEKEELTQGFTGTDAAQMNQMLAAYNRIAKQAEFAQRRYRLNLNILEEVRIQSIQQHRFLAILERPFVPESSERPRRLRGFLTWAILGLLLTNVVKLLWSSVREHGQQYS